MPLNIKCSTGSCYCTHAGTQVPESTVFLAQLQRVHWQGLRPQTAEIYAPTYLEWAAVRLQGAESANLTECSLLPAHWTCALTLPHCWDMTSILQQQDKDRKRSDTHILVTGFS